MNILVMGADQEDQEFFKLVFLASQMRNHEIIVLEGSEPKKDENGKVFAGSLFPFSRIRDFMKIDRLLIFDFDVRAFDYVLSIDIDKVHRFSEKDVLPVTSNPAPRGDPAGPSFTKKTIPIKIIPARAQTARILISRKGIVFRQ